MDRIQEKEVTKDMYAAWDELVPRIIELAQVESSTAARMLMSDIEDSTNKGNWAFRILTKISTDTKLTEYRSLIAACALYLLVPEVRTKLRIWIHYQLC